MSIKRFRKFIDDVISSGDWEYGDGESLTEDAKDFLEQVDNLKLQYLELHAAAQNVVNAKNAISHVKIEPGESTTPLIEAIQHSDKMIRELESLLDSKKSKLSSNREDVSKYKVMIENADIK